jgi:DNA-binding transcriptional regulator PaaX
VTYEIKIEFKENRYRYTLSDFNLKTASRFPIEKWMNKEDPSYNKNWDSYLYQIDTTMQRLVSTLKEKMKPTVAKKDEW